METKEEKEKKRSSLDKFLDTYVNVNLIGVAIIILLVATYVLVSLFR